MKGYASGPAGRKYWPAKRRLKGGCQAQITSSRLFEDELDAASTLRRQAGRHEKPPGVRYGAQQDVEEIYPV